MTTLYGIGGKSYLTFPILRGNQYKECISLTTYKFCHDNNTKPFSPIWLIPRTITQSPFLTGNKNIEKTGKT